MYTFRNISQRLRLIYNFGSLGAPDMNVRPLKQKQNKKLMSYMYHLVAILFETIQSN